MTPEEINSAIAQVKSDIAAKEASISAAQSNIEQLETLEGNCISCEDALDTSKNDKKLKLEEIVEVENQKNFIDAYYEALLDLLEGDYFTNACEGVEDAKSDIQQEISNQYSKIGYYQYELAGLKKSLLSLEGKLSS